MDIRPIRSQDDYERGLLEIKRLWNARPGTEDADKLETLGILVEAYEQRVYLLPNPDPVEAIKFRMEQEGLTSADLLPIFGTRGRVSEVLRHRFRMSSRPARRRRHRERAYRHRRDRAHGLALHQLRRPRSWPRGSCAKSPATSSGRRRRGRSGRRRSCA